MGQGGQIGRCRRAVRVCAERVCFQRNDASEWSGRGQTGPPKRRECVQSVNPGARGRSGSREDEVRCGCAATPGQRPRACPPAHGRNSRGGGGARGQEQGEGRQQVCPQQARSTGGRDELFSC